MLILVDTLYPLVFIWGIQPDVHQISSTDLHHVPLVPKHRWCLRPWLLLSDLKDKNRVCMRIWHWCGCARGGPGGQAWAVYHPSSPHRAWPQMKLILTVLGAKERVYCHLRGGRAPTRKDTTSFLFVSLEVMHTRSRQMSGCSSQGSAWLEPCWGG